MTTATILLYILSLLLGVVSGYILSNKVIGLMKNKNKQSFYEPLPEIKLEAVKGLKLTKYNFS